MHYIDIIHVQKYIRLFILNILILLFHFFVSTSEIFSDLHFIALQRIFIVITYLYIN